MPWGLFVRKGLNVTIRKLVLNLRDSDNFSHRFIIDVVDDICESSFVNFFNPAVLTDEGVAESPIEHIFEFSSSAAFFNFVK